jgi:hypothetical protein
MNTYYCHQVKNICLFSLAAITLLINPVAYAGDYTIGNYDIRGSRSIPDAAEPNLTLKNFKKNDLEVKWFTPTDKPVVAAPLVYKGVVYVGTTDIGFNNTGVPQGSFYALDAKSGAIKKSITVPSGVFASALIDGNELYIVAYDGTLHKYDLALNLLWSYHSNFNTGVNVGFNSGWQGPIKINNGKKSIVILGINPSDEFPGVNSLGNAGIAAVDAKTGIKVWERLITAPGTGGSGVWATSPSFSKKLNLIFITTGQTTRVNPNPPNLPTSSDSVYALDAQTGDVVWHTQVRKGDVAQGDIWSFSNYFDPKNPKDTDIGDGAALFSVNGKEYVAMGSKRGYFYVMDAKTGNIVNKTSADYDNLGFVPSKLDAFNYNGSGVVGNGPDGGFNLDSGYYSKGNDVIHFGIVSDYTQGLGKVGAALPPFNGGNGNAPGASIPAGTCMIAGFGLGSAQCPGVPDKSVLIFIQGDGKKEVARFSKPGVHMYSPLYINDLMFMYVTPFDSITNTSSGLNSVLVLDVSNLNKIKEVQNIPLQIGSTSASSQGSQLSISNGMIYAGSGFLPAGAPTGLYAIGLKNDPSCGVYNPKSKYGSHHDGNDD